MLRENGQADTEKQENVPEIALFKKAFEDWMASGEDEESVLSIPSDQSLSSLLSRYMSSRMR